MNDSDFIPASKVLAMLPFRATKLWLARQKELKAVSADDKLLFQRDEVERWIERKFPRDDSKPARAVEQKRPERTKRTPRARN